ncbi:MAG: OsmC family protein [Gammaproteobacteria bacterium]|nr:OsmC family protein [Gammaproteobacteria bacterium]MDH4313896.1 OsmC family protein [Gammaproteobacteria bacterium]MDH5213829.1 OsmC family protein [Gammaproteobacteria bacterium]
MQEFPHHYSVTASLNPDSNVELSSNGLTTLQSAAPAEFGGPGDQWSPETLLIAAVADCFVLSFKAIARASRFGWSALQCAVQGKLDRTPSGTQFTSFDIVVKLTVPAGSDETKARKLLQKAEHACLITNSLKAMPDLQADVLFDT